MTRPAWYRHAWLPCLTLAWLGWGIWAVVHFPQASGWFGVGCGSIFFGVLCSFGTIGAACELHEEDVKEWKNQHEAIDSALQAAGTGPIRRGELDAILQDARQTTRLFGKVLKGGDLTHLFATRQF